MRGDFLPRREKKYERDGGFHGTATAAKIGNRKLAFSLRLNIKGEAWQIPGDIAHISANTVHLSEILGDEGYVFVTAKDSSWSIQGARCREHHTGTHW